MTPSAVVLPMERAQALLNYLTTKPYHEVAGFVQFLVEAQPHEEENVAPDSGATEGTAA